MKQSGFRYSVDRSQLGYDRRRHGAWFITDAKGRKTAAVIDIKKHSALWEDIQDVLVSRSRRLEKRIPLENVKSRLIGSGKLRG